MTDLGLTGWGLVVRIWCVACQYRYENIGIPGVQRALFAGEVLDVDAVTGGFNLQAAWTMGYVVAENIVKQ